MKTLTLKKRDAVEEAVAQSNQEQSLDTRAERIEAAIKAKMSPPGALGLPKLLDERRVKYGIPDEAFEMHAAFDRVLVNQILPKHEEGRVEKWGDSSIIRPETSQDRILKQSSRAIIVTAGLLALDQLRSNGLDLGHIVNFVRQAPWHQHIATYEGHDKYLINLRCGDIVSSEDLMAAVRAGKVRVQRDSDSQQHFLTDADGHTWKPELPFMDESY